MLPPRTFRRWLGNFWLPDLTPRHPSRTRRVPCRLLLESLEDRTTPSVTFLLGPPVPAPPGAVQFTAIRAGDPAPAVQVNYATVDGSAHAGTDYAASSGTLLFPANATTETISVPVLNSAIFQAPGSFGVALSNPMASAAFAPRKPSPQVVTPSPWR
jgi:hypothetical protein